MGGKEEHRIFVGGLSWDVTERQLESAFSRFGKILESQILQFFCKKSLRISNTLGCLVHSIINNVKVMLERETGRPRGFGFITFSDHRAMDDAIREMHGREFGDRLISVNKAQPKMGGEDMDHGYRGGYSSGGRGGYGGGDRPAGPDDCFKCGRPGHWARDCPSVGGRGGGGSSFPSRSRFGGAGDRGDRFGGDRDRYMDDRYDGGRYGDRNRFDSRDNKYGSQPGDRYPPPMGDRFGGDRYRGSDRYGQNGYGKDRGYGGPRVGGERYGADRYGGGVPHNDRNYRTRPGPYDRPSRAGRPNSFERF